MSEEPGKTGQWNKRQVIRYLLDDIKLRSDELFHLLKKSALSREEMKQARIAELELKHFVNL